MNPYHEYPLPELKTIYTSMLNFPPHFHSHIEILMVFKGTVNITVDSKPYILTEGDCIIIFPNAIHSYPEVSVDNIALLIICSPLFISKFQFSNSLTSKYAVNPLQNQSTMHPDSVYAINALREKGDTMITSEECHLPDAEHTSVLLHLFLSGFLSKLQLKEKIDSSTQELSLKVVRYITDNYRNPLSENDVANFLGVSRFRITNIFTKQLQISFSRFLNELRIEEAKRLLTSTCLSITNISIMCGFNTTRTFNRTFLNLTGEAPREFRKRFLMDSDASHDAKN